MIGQFSLSSCSKYGTCESEQLRASFKTKICELHVSSPYEFLLKQNTILLCLLYAECHHQGEMQVAICGAGVNVTGNVNPVPLATVTNTGTCEM